ncbi:MAG: hypothetical protein ACYTGB_12170 [Planctomycetota bacterium]|jgi:hypothetical protein
MKRFLAALTLVAAAYGAPAAAGEVNVWRKLESPGNGHWGNNVVWCPARKQLLNYTAFDVMAYDAGKSTWSKDCPWPGDKGFGITSIHNNNRGVTYKGTGLMTPSGVPCPALTVNGLTWDSKRGKMVLLMHGLMAAYDPATKKWSEIKCSTDLGDGKRPGAPRVYGPGIAYDPVNDEIVMFPHWGAPNRDLEKVTGELSGHLGTLVYSFRDSTWTRRGEDLASPEVAAARRAVLDVSAKLSAALDLVYAARRGPKVSADAVKALQALVAEVKTQKKTQLLDLGGVLKPLESALAGGRGGKLEDALRSGADALWELRAMPGRAPLTIQPPPRCATQMVYHPETKGLVMFGGMGALRRTDLEFPRGKGGNPGNYSDTWVYDCAKRRWRELACKGRPPGTTNSKLVYDPASKKLVLVTASSSWGGQKGELTLWTLDVAKAAWQDCGTQAAPDGMIPRLNWTGWGNPTFELGYDPEVKLLLLVGSTGSHRKKTPVNYALRLDVARLAAKPAPNPTAPPPVKPLKVPPDDPAWVARLKSQPANTWVAAKPEGGETPRRDWGVAACDPVRGHVHYFGGGHSTYQGRDVAIYSVGANRWVHGAGGHNDHLPAVGWGGINYDFYGSPAAAHQRNSYVALDGRLYKSFGTGTMRPEYRNPAMAEKGPRWSLFCDLDRGGVWRSPRIDDVAWGEGVKGTYAGVHMATPDGRVIGFGGQLEPYNGRKCPGVLHFASLDVYRNKLTVKNVKPPFPGVVMEVRPFCYVADRGKAGSVFFYEHRKGGGNATWLYDVEKNAFTDLKPPKQPGGDPGTVLYLPDQKAIFAVINRSAQWVYSLEKNAWTQLPKAGANVKFTGPYTQMVYSAKYGVLVNLPGTHLMRPDFSKLKWE